MTNFKPGDIVLVDFIFSEQNESKKRPALIISTEEYNKNRKDIIIAAITSNIARILLGDTLIEDWKKAELLYPSLITAVIQTIKNDMIIRKLGILSKKDLENCKKNLNKSLSLVWIVSIIKVMGLHEIKNYYRLQIITKNKSEKW